jgi:hypothetical protein
VRDVIHHSQHNEVIGRDGWVRKTEGVFYPGSVGCALSKEGSASWGSDGGGTEDEAKRSLLSHHHWLCNRVQDWSRIALSKQTLPSTVVVINSAALSEQRYSTASLQVGPFRITQQNPRQLGHIHPHRPPRRSGSSSPAITPLNLIPDPPHWLRRSTKSTIPPGHVTSSPSPQAARPDADVANQLHPT